MRILRVKNWEQFQHYKDRDPSWIKLYRDTLTSEVWVLGNDLSRLLQLASTLLAARYKNAIPLKFDLWRKVAHLDCSPECFTRAIEHLVAHDFVEIQGVEDDASTALAERYAREEKRRLEKSRDTTAASRPARSEVSRETSEWWLDFKLAYPSRAGGQPWRRAEKAANARIAEGHSPADLIAGARRYAAFIEATGKENTEYVQQAATFLGPEKHFLLPWHPPQKQESATAKLLRNLNSDDRVIEHEPDSTETRTLTHG